MRHEKAIRCVIGSMLLVGGCAHEATTTKPPPRPVSGSSTWPVRTPVADSAGVDDALGGIIKAISRGDESSVADSMLLPMKLSREQTLLYARRIILGSQLQWLISEKFGAAKARIVMVRGQLEFIPRLDPAGLKWTAAPAPQSAAAGSLEVVIGRPTDRSEGWVVMARMAGGWKLDRSGANASLLAMHLEDAPWRNAVVQRVMDEVKSGKLGSADAVGNALILHAPATRPDTRNADRSRPEGAIVALFDAIETGDATTVADSFVFMRETDKGAARKQLAERVVADRKLAKALRVKFGPEQGARLEAGCSLRVKWPDIYREVPWVVDGDVARAVLDENRYGHRYDAAMRMIRAGGIWRIELPPTDLGEWRRPKSENEKELDRWIADAARRENDVLTHLDKYPTPGSVLDALEFTSAGERHSDDKTLAKQADEEVRQVRKEIAMQPAATTQQAFDQQMGIMRLELTAAFVRHDASAAAKFYIVDGDDGAYAVARETRALAIHELSEAAGKEIGSGASSVMGGMLDVADDLYGMAMIEWKVQGDQAVGTGPGGASADEFWVPKLRKVGGEWKIDVTGETDGDAKAAAVRALDETKKIEQLTQDVKALKFKNVEQFKAAIIKAGIKGANRPSG